MWDFTLLKYRELCKAILEKHKPVTVAEYLEKKQANVAILRHDVDRLPGNALEMAEIENGFGMRSTYYFRTVPEVFKADMIKQIHEMGHEIGFHYEVLDKSKGDYSQAVRLFRDELGAFPFPVKTICMHGNPLTPWDNRKLWEKYNYLDYGVIGEAYLSIDYSKVLYFTDTGRAWNGKYSVKDHVKAENPYQKELSGTDSLIKLLKERELGDICILTHPDRWSDSYYKWSKQLVAQSIKNKLKKAIKWYRK